MATENQSIPYLPPEIIEILFTHFDGDTFLNAAQTCKSWSHIAIRHKKNSQAWQRICLKELTNDDIITVHQFFNGPTPDWFLVYKCYKRWRNISKASHFIMDIFPEEYTHNETSRHISCARAVGKNVVVSVENNGFYVFTDTHIRNFFALRNGNRGSMYVVNPGLLVDIGSVIHTINLEKPEQSTAQCIPNFVNGKCISVDRVQQKIYCFTHRKLYQFTKFDDPPEIANQDPWDAKTLAVTYGSGQITLLSVWDGKITIMNNYGVLYKLDKKGSFRKSMTYTCPKVFTVHDWYIFCEETVIGISDHAEMIILRGGASRSVNCMEIFQSYPITVLLHGRLLFLGLHSGTVCMYSCTDVMTLNFDDASLCTQQIYANSPIISLDVVENENCLQIVVATRCKVLIDYIGLH